MQRIAPVDAFEHVTQLSCGDRDHPIGGRRPDKAAALQSLGVIFITWDDWGGWFDHVDPPVIEKWSSAHAQRPADAHPEFNGDPFRYGSRVPCLVLSPYAKAGHISRQPNSHVSLVRFCQQIFGLPALNQRDDTSNAMSDCFDFTQQPLPPPR